MRDVAHHPRRLAEQHVQVHVDRVVAEARVGNDEAMPGRRPPDNGEWTALALADRAESLEILGSNCEHVAFLRLVAPDLARRHPGFLGRYSAEIELCASAAAVDELR